MRVKDRGAFVDISDQFPDIFRREKPDANNESGERPTPVDRNQTWLAIIDIVARVTDGGRPGVKFNRQAVRDEFERQQPLNEALRHVAPEHQGKNSRKDFSLSWYLTQMRDFGAIADEKHSRLVVVDLELARARFRPAAEAPGAEQDLCEGLGEELTGALNKTLASELGSDASVEEMPPSPPAQEG